VTTAAYPAPRDLQVPLVRTASQERLENQVNLGFLVAHPPSACRRFHRSANPAPQGRQDPPGLRESQVPPALLVSPETPAKMVAQERLAHKVPPVHLANQAPMDPPAMPDSQRNRPRPPPGSPDLRDHPARRGHLDPTAALGQMDSLVDLDPRDRPGRMDSPATLAKMVDQGPKDPPDRPERRASVRSIALWTVVSSSKMGCDDKRPPELCCFHIHFVLVYLLSPYFSCYPQAKRKNHISNSILRS